MQESEVDLQTTEKQSGSDIDNAGSSGQEGDKEEKETTELTPKDDGIPQLTGIQLYALLASMLLLIFIIILDISVLATAIPHITDEFHTIADIGWYGSAYTLGQCSVQPLSGRIYSMFRFKASFLIFFGIFELGSLICGVAQSSNMLVVGRAICGVGSAGLTNAILTVIGVVSPPKQKALNMGIVTSLSSCGQIIGPLIGGALTQHASWRWCFYLNLPVGGLTSLGFLFTPFPVLRGKKEENRSFKSVFMSLDMPGFLLFAPSCVMLLLALEWAGIQYAWKSATIIGLLCGAAGGFISFILWERKHGDYAMIPQSLVGNRRVFCSCLVSFFNGGGMTLLSYYLAIYFQATKHASPTNSGVYMLPTFGSQVLLAILTGILMRKIRYTIFPLLLGGALITVSFGLFTTIKINSSAGEWIGYQILGGAGRGMMVQMPILVVHSTVAKAQLPTGTAIVMWSQFFGMAIFLGAAQTLFLQGLKTGLHDYAPSLDATAISNAGATGFESVVAPQYDKPVARAYDKGVVTTFYLGLALAIIALIAALGVGRSRLDTPKPNDGPKAAGEGGDDDDDAAAAAASAATTTVEDEKGPGQ